MKEKKEGRPYYYVGGLFTEEKENTANFKEEKAGKAFLPPLGTTLGRRKGKKK